MIYEMVPWNARGSWKQEGYDITLKPVPAHRSLEQSSVDLSREQRMLSSEGRLSG